MFSEMRVFVWEVRLLNNQHRLQGKTNIHPKGPPMGRTLIRIRFFPGDTPPSTDGGPTHRLINL